jgi:hypothetical protein
MPTAERGRLELTAELGGRNDIARAAKLVREAIRLLDAAGAPSDIAAHLDLAVARLDTLADARPADHGTVLQSPRSDVG